MAGPRRATGKPLRRDLQAQRAKRRLIERLAGSDDPTRQLRHAFDYLCSAVAHAPRGEKRTAEMAREFTRRGDELWREKKS